jgi:hypothetical protein
VWSLLPFPPPIVCRHHARLEASKVPPNHMIYQLPLSTTLAWRISTTPVPANPWAWFLAGIFGR